ncbi:hypothetical protein [Streptomyces sp. H27-D2]|uniref:hypothetical protein n=1 Tax=Streptomyces sp. H27-D2 TaxID=3046304 RepID=UPI002DBB7FCB|nr:hypothetical protein [Streptomyces sp. H27-D2]MEC4017467.1 hypothetical protein [Streptomyces sp. H27-D2]
MRTAAGKPVPIQHESAVHSREQLGKVPVALINRRPLRQHVTRKDRAERSNYRPLRHRSPARSRT